MVMSLIIVNQSYTVQVCLSPLDENAARVLPNQFVQGDDVRREKNEGTPLLLNEVYNCEGPLYLYMDSFLCSGSRLHTWKKKSKFS